MPQCHERSATFPLLRWTIGDGVTSGSREKDVSKTRLQLRLCLSYVILRYRPVVIESTLPLVRVLLKAVAKNGPGSALSEC